MDARYFDHLARSLSTASPRRRLLTALASLSLFSSLAWPAAETEAKPRKRKKCKPKPRGKTCQGKCGIVRNNCKKKVDCGACGCESGTCEQPDNPCREAYCDPETGLCAERDRDNGSPCSVADLCVVNETCQSGVCQGQTIFCPPPAGEQCKLGICNPQTGQCEARNRDPGTPCNDGDICTIQDACNFDGVCAGIQMPCFGGRACCPTGPNAGKCGYEGVGDPCFTDSDCCTGNCFLGSCFFE